MNFPRIIVAAGSNNVVVEATGALVAFSPMGDIVRVGIGANGPLPPVVIIPQNTFEQFLTGPKPSNSRGDDAPVATGRSVSSIWRGDGWPYPQNQTIIKFSQNTATTRLIG